MILQNACSLLFHNTGSFIPALFAKAALAADSAITAAAPAVQTSPASQAALAAVDTATAAAATGPISGPIFWAIVMTIAVGNFLLRAVFVFAMERIPLTDNLKLILKYIPAAVITALIAPAFVLYQGSADFSSLTPLLSWLDGKERLLAGIAALAIALWKRSMILIILVGMAMLWLLQWGFA